MTVRVHTLMYGNAFERYGWFFAKAFDTYWPESMALTVFTDQFIPAMARHDQVMLQDLRPVWEFYTTHRGNPRAEGRESTDRKAVPGKRFWKHDAVKWAPQAMVSHFAADKLSAGDTLVWLDADVETISSIPEDWPERILDGKQVAALWRGRQHPDIGFWAVRIGTGTRSALFELMRLYREGRIFSMPEWHSAYAWQRVMNAIPESQRRNLNPENLTGHPWPKTVLAEHLVHHKGKLKERIR